MLKKISMILAVLIIGVGVLSACGGSEAPPPTNTPVPAAPAAEDTAASEEQTAPAEPAAGSEAETEAPQEEVAASGEQAAPEEPAAAADSSGSGQEAAPEAVEAAGEIRTFVIVPDQSKASYMVKEEFFGGALDRLGIAPGLSDTVGSTQEINGEMQLDLANLANPVVASQFTVNIQSLTSNQSRRDQTIRERFLASDNHPLAEFTILSVENSPAALTEGEEIAFQASGNLTIREVTQPTTFEVTATLAGDTITGVASTRLKMTDFGFDPPNIANMFSVEDEFTAQVEFTFKEQ